MTGKNRGSAATARRWFYIFLVGIATSLRKGTLIEGFRNKDTGQRPIHKALWYQDRFFYPQLAKFSE